MNSDGFSRTGQRAEVAWALHRAQQFVTSAGQAAFPRIAKGNTNSLIPTLEWENGFAAQEGQEPSLNADILSLLSHGLKDPNPCGFRVGELDPRSFINSLVEGNCLTMGHRQSVIPWAFKRSRGMKHLPPSGSPSLMGDHCPCPVVYRRVRHRGPRDA
uniref:Uncharacterized protein n=1 Tax=Pipistrellus kuhlii TaxID=59472 RepID=A0A7J7U7Y0_PIPKU|nr:hypothetical protein mPipKuh1_009169 [Pipistrellus kuhlii]